VLSSRQMRGAYVGSVRKGWVPVAVVLVVAAGLASWFGLRSSTTTTTAATTTTVASAEASAVWPTPGSGITYSSPTVAAEGFAVDVLGMARPVVGSFRPGDSRSGEVPIKSTSSGPETTVLVRQLSGSAWSVIGASTADIKISSPSALARVTSPLHLSGSSTAFEAVVNVTLRGDAIATPVVTTTVKGGANGVMRPFSASISFTAPASGYGDVILYTRSAKDGSVVAASVLRVRF
jgi:Immunoglobulin-like domain of bacterial spore germination